VGNLKAASIGVFDFTSQIEEDNRTTMFLINLAEIMSMRTIVRII
jgi:hypothetical protein